MRSYGGTVYSLDKRLFTDSRWVGVLDALLHLNCINKTWRYHYKRGFDDRRHFTELRSRGSEPREFSPVTLIIQLYCRY